MSDNNANNTIGFQKVYKGVVTSLVKGYRLFLHDI